MKLKFRVWDKEEGKMRGNIANLSICMDGTLFWNFAGNIEFLGFPKDTSYVIMQFTGIKDKNGKEIYDGDIIDFSDEFQKIDKPVIGRVYWKNGGFMYKLNKTVLTEPGGLDLKKSKVIGNIHENPELFEEKGESE